MAEKAVRAILRPDEAPYWLYQVDRGESERSHARNRDGPIPRSAPMVEEVAGFWRRNHGIKH